MALMLATFSLPVQAHPHSFIDMQTTLVTRDKTVIALKMVWTMDEITSADLLYDAGNAAPGSEIWKKLAAEVMARVMAQHYFTNVYRDGKPVRYMRLPSEYQLSRSGNKAVLEFVMPFAQPAPLVGKPLIFSTFDPTYFVDMTYKNDKALQLPTEVQPDCSLSLFTPKPNASMQAYALSLDKADAPPEDMDLGQQFAQKVTLQCH
ncbi:DUF1007 family protein [Rouxiella chamberiensis]|uniref:DUF1007 family protein n=2 Tax=Rouxiella chamberiensis TaxID=1513468 RepID=A0ABY7HU49_9GAMM|nr:DUF1007 family protein [Rouxiella chamberiensis]WAT02938.1 DUF1007 family protein [Rouxiella chamberiensis]